MILARYTLFQKKWFWTGYLRQYGMGWILIKCHAERVLWMWKAFLIFPGGRQL